MTKIIVLTVKTTRKQKQHKLENDMAQGGKVNTTPNHFREHYNPEPVDIYPKLCFSDMVLIWLSGVSVGVVLTLVLTGN